MSRYVVLAETKTNVTAYSSGPLSVGDLRELAIDIHVTSSSGGTPEIFFVGDGTSGDPPIDVSTYRYTCACTLAVSRLTAFGDTADIGGSKDLSIQTNDSVPRGNPAVPSNAVRPTGMVSWSFGSGETTECSFGDRVQVDLLNPQGITLTFTVSVIGK